MNRQFKQLGKDAFVYGFGILFAKGLGILLLPFYTRIFRPAAYGIIELLIVLTGLVNAISLMGMDSAQTNYFFQQKALGKRAQARLVTAILQWRIAVGSVLIATAIGLGPFLNRLLFHEELTIVYFVLAFLGVFFTQITGQCAQVFRLLFLPWPFLRLTLAESVLTAIFSILFIVVFKAGVMGYFGGLLLGSLITALIGCWAIRDYLDWHGGWHTAWWPKLAGFGAPLVPVAIGVYLMNSIDRWFVVHYHGETALGIYAVGAKFSLVLYLVIVAFRRAWVPIVTDIIHQRQGYDVIRLVAKLYLGFGIVLVLFLSAFAPLILKIFATESYLSAHTIVGLLAWSGIFYGFYIIAAIGLWIKEKNIYSTLSIALATLLNVGLNWLWVPAWGVIGAAAATSLSYLVWCALTVFFSERIMPIGYDIKLFAVQIFLGATASFLILTIQRSGEPMGQSVVIAVLFALLLTALTLRGCGTKKVLAFMTNRTQTE